MADGASNVMVYIKRHTKHAHRQAMFVNRLEYMEFPISVADAVQKVSPRGVSPPIRRFSRPISFITLGNSSMLKPVKRPLAHLDAYKTNIMKRQQYNEQYVSFLGLLE